MGGSRDRQLKETSTENILHQIKDLPVEMQEVANKQARLTKQGHNKPESRRMASATIGYKYETAERTTKDLPERTYL